MHILQKIHTYFDLKLKVLFLVLLKVANILIYEKRKHHFFCYDHNQVMGYYVVMTITYIREH